VAKENWRLASIQKFSTDVAINSVSPKSSCFLTPQRPTPNAKLSMLKIEPAQSSFTNLRARLEHNTNPYLTFLAHRGQLQAAVQG
jgi:hypothetical protein